MIQDRFNNDFNLLLRGEAPKLLAIAVSGGADSISLLHLTSIWAKEFDIKIFVFSVNHNLRNESSEEIQYVKHISEKLGHHFYELSWSVGSNKSALQERARQGRYDLMSSKCHELGIDMLLTAHHLDDMLETYLMRKSKKSGIFGLSSSNSFFHDNIRILRPLFDFSKIELINYLEANHIKWREDITNQSDQYERNRVRKKIASLSKESKIELQDEMKGINERALALNNDLIIAMAESIEINNYGFASIDFMRFKDNCLDIQIQILNYIVTVIGGKITLPRFRNLEKLLSQLQMNDNFKQSCLHGCIVKLKNDKLWIFRESAAIDNIKYKLKEFALWDNRFDISSANSADYYVGRLSFDEYLSIKDKIDLTSLAEISDNNHKLVLFTLPVIKNIKKIIAIPHISYYDEFVEKADINVVFRPNFISRFTHFL